MDTENSKTVRVPPIPTNVPSPPPLDNLPFDVLHSATVEMLIQQNGDLTSRLTVNIRRNSQLEQKILELEQKIKEVTHVRENLELQTDIMLEKEKKWTSEKEIKDDEILNLEERLILEKKAKNDKILNLKEKIEKITSQQNKLNTHNQENHSDLISRITQKDKEVLVLRDKISRLHRIRTLVKDRRKNLERDLKTLKHRYNELSEKTEKEKHNFETGIHNGNKEIHFLKKKIKQFHRLKNRAKDRLRVFLLQTARNFSHHQNQLDQSRSLNRQLAGNIESLRSDILKKEVEFKEQLHTFKRKSEERYYETSNQNENLYLQNKKLREIQEELQNEVNRLSTDFHEEKKNRIKIRHLSREVNDLKNEKIWIKRSLEEDLQKSEQNQQKEMEKVGQLKKELEQVQFTAEQQKEKLKSCEIKLLEMNKDNQELSSQLDSIQGLWVSTQEKLEKAELKSQSLEKINRELSGQFKTQRLDRITERTMETKTPPSAKEPETL